MPERYFNRQQAEELLPMLEVLLAEAIEQKRKVDEIDSELGQAASRVMLLGGSLLPYKELAEKKVRKDQHLGELQESVSKIEQTGCVLKDLDQGLVDFPSVIENQEAYLCWKLGEERIEYWHGLDEGFAGRKPLRDPERGSEPPRKHRPN